MEPIGIDNTIPSIDVGEPPRPKDERTPKQQNIAVQAILICILFERAAYYALVTTLVANLNSEAYLNWTSEHSALALFIFSCISCIASFVFAFLSDAILGRVWTIYIGFTWYIVGYVIASVITLPGVKACGKSVNIEDQRGILNESCAWWILVTLSIIAVGSAAIQSSMAVLGAEQIQQSPTTSRYFDKYMWMVNAGGIIGMLSLFFIPANRSYVYVGYLVAILFICLAVLSFIIGHKFGSYFDSSIRETIMLQSISILFTAVRQWCRSRGNGDSSTPLLTSVNSSSNRQHSASSSFSLSHAIRSGRYTDRNVKDVRSLGKALLVFAFLIPYFLVYQQINATFPLQGQHMHQPSNVNNFIQLMLLGDPVIIILGIPILIVYYKSKQVTCNESTLTCKFIIGMGIASITMITAGTIELFRRRQCNPETDTSTLSIYLLLLQTTLMGISELFAMVASYEFAYFAAPRSAQSIFMSLRFVSLGAASLIGSAFITAFPTPSFSLDFSCRIDVKMDWAFYGYFYILAGIQAFALILFWICDKTCSIIKINPQVVNEH